MIKNVENVKKLKSRSAPVQTLRRRKGITGSCRGFPCRADSILHSRTVSRMRFSSAFSSTSVLWARRRRSLFARWGNNVPATTPTTGMGPISHSSPMNQIGRRTDAVDQHSKLAGTNCQVVVRFLVFFVCHNLSDVCSAIIYIYIWERNSQKVNTLTSRKEKET